MNSLYGAYFYLGLVLELGIGLRLGLGFESRLRLGSKYIYGRVRFRVIVMIIRVTI